MSRSTRPRSRKGLSEQERADKRAGERELVRSSVERLRCSEGWQAWLAARSRFRRYSFANQLLIARQHPTATQVAGFRAWLGLGYCVRKSERAIRIWAPRPPSKKQIERWRESGGDAADKPSTSFGLVAVFAQDQINPLPPPATPAPLEPPMVAIEGDSLKALLDPLARLAASIGYAVAFESLDGPDGVCDHGARRIAVDQGLTPNGRVAACAHELAHALVRVDRQDDDPKLTYAQEELVVESIAFSVCTTAGLDTSANSIPYLASWSQSTDLGVLERTAQLIDRLANRIEDALNLETDGTTVVSPRDSASDQAPLSSPVPSAA